MRHAGFHSSRRRTLHYGCPSSKRC
ncbi:hypothetical protein E2C01_086263 [Portunus trituberculatus]|uniref:Uncharacterized protein n=1 Tax=Portunus trituberculatus TaxID=210409 RepID=A0A5B7J8T8_PORTR|nr:hypothetical protein [Portunus trituberculatus]